MLLTKAKEPPHAAKTTAAAAQPAQPLNRYAPTEATKAACLAFNW